MLQSSIQYEMLQLMLSLLMLLLFCVNCLQYLVCDHKKQKILTCNNLAILMAFDAMNGGRLFGKFDVNLIPISWNKLISKAISKINDLKLSSQRRQQAHSINNRG